MTVPAHPTPPRDTVRQALLDILQMLKTMRHDFTEWAANLDKRSRAGEFGKWPWQKDYGLWPWQRRRRP